MTSRAERQRQATATERAKWRKKLKEAEEMKAIQQAALRELISGGIPSASISVGEIRRVRRVIGMKPTGTLASSVGKYWGTPSETAVNAGSPSPEAALQLIIKHIKREAKGDPDELFRLTGEWMTKITNALSDLNKHESQE